MVEKISFLFHCFFKISTSFFWETEIVTEAHTDLWQRTYYHFRNDNAPVLQMETEEKYFNFVVETDFADSRKSCSVFRM